VTLKSIETSPRVKSEKKRSQLVDINLRSVVAITAAGGGLASLRRFCTNFNFPEPVTENSYNNYLHHLESHAKSNCDISMHNAAKELRQEIIMNNNNESESDDIGQILNTAVSVDGSCQKRYGHNSLNGLVYIISIETGRVLDYVVKTKVCHVCKSNPNADDNWKKEHAKVCCINHTGSAGSMEVQATLEMFLRSIERYNLRYTTYVGDGDSSAFGTVRDAVLDKFGEDYSIVKEDCIGHIQKRMGAALRNYKTVMTASKVKL